MKLARFERRGKAQWGILEADRVFSVVGDVYGDFWKGGDLCALSDVNLLAPAEPAIMVCVGINYVDATNSSGNTISERREEPSFFLKPASTLSNPGDGVRYPQRSEDPHLEVELCAVIRRRAKNLSVADVPDYILGYTCGNDLGAMDIIRMDKNVTRGRGFDGAGPVGPWLVTDLDIRRLALRSRVNGEIKQNSSTDQMIFSIPELIHHITAFMTLQPGDVVWSGTPRGRAPVKVGDVMEVEVEGIGVLRNLVLPPT